MEGGALEDAPLPDRWIGGLGEEVCLVVSCVMLIPESWWYRSGDCVDAWCCTPIN